MLLRLPSGLGDVVAAEPVLRAFAERWSSAGALERVTVAAPARLHSRRHRAAR